MVCSQSLVSDLMWAIKHFKAAHPVNAMGVSGTIIIKNSPSFIQVTKGCKRWNPNKCKVKQDFVQPG